MGAAQSLPILAGGGISKIPGVDKIPGIGNLPDIGDVMGAGHDVVQIIEKALKLGANFLQIFVILVRQIIKLIDVVLFSLQLGLFIAPAIVLLAVYIYVLYKLPYPDSFKQDIILYTGPLLVILVIMLYKYSDLTSINPFTHRFISVSAVLDELNLDFDGHTKGHTKGQNIPINAVVMDGKITTIDQRNEEITKATDEASREIARQTADELAKKQDALTDALRRGFRWGPR